MRSQKVPVLLCAAACAISAFAQVAARLEFESPVDGSRQPYRLYAPPNPGAEPMPLVVVLHGAHGDENTYFDRYLSRESGERVLEKLARERGYIVASPRRYQGEFERDVLAMIDHLAESHAVRLDQVFLTGHSSGGVGTWRIGYRHSHRFAGMAAVGSAFSAQPHVLHALIGPGEARKPMMYVQGVRDELVPNRQARALVAAMNPRLDHFVYREFPDAHGSLGTSSLPAVFDFFDSIRNEEPSLESDEPTEQELALVKKRSGKRKARVKMARAKGKKQASSKRTASKKAGRRTPGGPAGTGRAQMLRTGHGASRTIP